MVRARLHLEGDEQLSRNLQMLHRGGLFSALRAGARAGAGVIRKRARRLAPKQSGNLRRSIGVQVKVVHRGGIVRAIIGPRVDYKMTRSGLRGRTIQRVGRSGSRSHPSEYAVLIETGKSRNGKRRLRKRPGGYRYMHRGLREGASEANKQVRQGIKRRTASILLKGAKK